MVVANCDFLKKCADQDIQFVASYTDKSVVTLSFQQRAARCQVKSWVPVPLLRWQMSVNHLSQ